MMARARGARRGIFRAPAASLPSGVDEQDTSPSIRIKVIGAIGLVILSILVLRLWSLQVLNTKSAAATVHANLTRTVTLPAERGLITDRTNSVLVSNRVVYRLVLSQDAVTSDPTIVGKVAALLGETPAQVMHAVMNPNYYPYVPAPISGDLTPTVLSYFSTHQQDYPNVAIQVGSERTYPSGGTVANQVLGYVNQGSTVTSQVGGAGLEAEYEQYLAGKPGSQTLVVNPVGNVIGVASTHNPTSGDTIVTNIDGRLQHELETVLAQQIEQDRITVDARSGRFPPAINGAAVVLDPRTGAVLALASYPSYNLSLWNGGISSAAFKGLLASGALNNYVTQGLFTPGSTFKLVTATAALNTGLYSANNWYPDTGTFKVPGCSAGKCVFHDDETGGTGAVNLPLALTRSSDVYFYNLGYLFWSAQGRLGKEPVQQTASHYGLNNLTGIDLPNENFGHVDSPSIRAELHAKYPKAYPYPQWYTGDNLEMAFGQGGTIVTPLGLATAYATFANGGTRYAPEVAAAVMSPSGKPVITFGPKVVDHVPLPASTRDPILSGLIGVVNDPTGTAYQSFQQYAHVDSSFVIAGKTGTASNAPGLEPNSWFVGMAPASAPRYVVLCVIGQGGYGAAAAAPVVAKTMTYLFHHRVGPVVLPTPTRPPQTPSPTTAVSTHRSHPGATTAK